MTPIEESIFRYGSTPIEAAMTLWGLRFEEAVVLYVLLVRYGSTVSRDTIKRYLEIDGKQVREGYVQTLVSRLRKKLPPYLKIEAIWGGGYAVRVPADWLAPWG